MKYVIIFFALFALNTTVNAQTKKNTTHQMRHAKEDCVMMKDGNMMMMKKGKMMEMENDVTMKNGTVCMTDGTCKMKNGDKCYMDGRMMKMGKMDKMKM